MTAPAAIQGDYVDLKFIRTRKVAQIVIEIPMEQASTFMTAFGAPRPDGNVPVALARLDVKAGKDEPGMPFDVMAKAGEAIATGARKRSRAQEAGILCGDARFRRFMSEEIEPTEGIAIFDLDMAADAVRRHCGVTSRSRLDTNPAAAQIWDRLADRYYAWLQVAA